MSYFLKLNIGGFGYILPNAWDPNNPDNFSVLDNNGNPTTVNPTFGAQLVAGSRAFNLLNILYNQDNAENATANWNTILADGAVANLESVLEASLQDALKSSIESIVSFNPYTVSDFVGSLESQAKGDTVNVVELAECAFGIHEAESLINNSYSMFLKLTEENNAGQFISYSELQSSIDGLIAGLSLGQSMSSDISSIEKFSEQESFVSIITNTFNSILDDVKSAIQSAIADLDPIYAAQLAIKDFSDDVASITGDATDFLKIAQTISDAFNVQSYGYAPMTSTGLYALISTVTPLPFVHSGSTQTPTSLVNPQTLPATTLPVANPVDGYGHSYQTATSISVGSVYQGALDAAETNDWFSVYLTAGHSYQFFLNGAPWDGLTSLLDPHIYIFGTDGKSEFVDAPEIDGSAAVAFTALTSGQYDVEIASDVLNPAGGYDFHYVDLGTISPPTTISAPVEAPTLSLSTEDPDVSEEAQTFHFEIESSTTLTAPVTVEWTVTGNGAHPATETDFVATSGSETLEPNAAGNYGFNVFATDNGVNEYDKDFQIQISVISGNASVVGGPIDCEITNSNSGNITPSVEPTNTDFSDAIQVAVNSYANGFIVSGSDNDYYKFYLTAGATYQIAAFGTSSLQNWSGADVSTGYAALQYPEASLLSSSGTVLISSLPPLNGAPSEVSDNITPLTTGYYFLDVKSEYPNSVGEYAVLVSEQVPPDDYANNTSTSGSVSVGATATGDLERTGDSDWFRVSLSAGETYDAYALGLNGGASNGFYWQNALPLTVQIYNSNGSLVASPFFGPGFTTENVAQFTASVSGTYYVSVSGTNGATGDYAVGVSEQSVTPIGDAVSILQPGPGDGDENWLNGTYDTTVTAGSSTQIDIGVDSNGNSTGLAIEFSLGSLPTYAAAAYLELYCPSPTGYAESLVVGVPLKPWTDESPLYAEHDTYSVTAPDNISFIAAQPVPQSPGWYDIDITQIYNEWQSGALANYGIQIFASAEGFDAATFDSDEDTVVADRPKLVVYAAQPNAITATPGGTSIEGTPGPDDIDASVGHLYVNAAGGDDTITGGAYDTIDGGTGSNTVTYAGSTAPVTVDLTSNGNHGGGAEGDTLLNIEEVIGSTFNDVLTAGLNGSTLQGGAGNNTLVGGPGNDFLIGGAGTNTVVYDTPSSSATIVRNADGSWTVTTSGGGTDTLESIQRAQFSDRTLSLDPANVDLDDFTGSTGSEILLENEAGAVVIGALNSGVFQYNQVSALGPEWAFGAFGDFLDDGKSQILIENTNGAVVVGSVDSAAVQYISVASLGPEWRIEGAGDFLGVGGSQFLIENTSGSVVVGQIINGSAQYTQLATLGPEWQFVGTGDFLGDAIDDFLIENTSGAVVVGENFDGKLRYTQVAALGSEWRFVATGDFTGDGKSEFLIENTAGAVVLGDVISGHVSFTQVAALGPEWRFVGSGDYMADGVDSFLIENTTGAVVMGTIAGGQTTFVQVSALGPEWKFHN